MKILGLSLFKTREIEPIIEKSNQLEKTNQHLEKQLREQENELRICKQLLDASQNSVIQLSRNR